MIESIPLPEGAVDVVGSEYSEFVVKAKTHSVVRGAGIWGLLSSLFWLCISVGVALLFFWPVLHGESMQIEINGVMTTAGPGNYLPIIIPAILFLVFIGASFLPLIISIWVLSVRGGYFIGTATRLIHYKKGNTRSVPWGDFSGDIQVTGDDKKGNVYLQLKRGGETINKQGQKVSLVDGMYMQGISHALEIGEWCRKKMKEYEAKK